MAPTVQRGSRHNTDGINLFYFSDLLLQLKLSKDQTSLATEGFHGS